MRFGRNVPVPEFDRPIRSTKEVELAAEVGVARAQYAAVSALAGIYREALRILAKGLLEAASGTLEGPDIEVLLEKAELIFWTEYDPDNPVHRGAFLEFEVFQGDRVWLATDFAQELLKHGLLPAPPSGCGPGSTAPSSLSEAPDGQTSPAPE